MFHLLCVNVTRETKYEIVISFEQEHLNQAVPGIFEGDISRILRRGYARIILDLRNVLSMNDEMVDAIVLIERTMKGADQELVFCNLTDAVQITFDRMGVSKFLDVKKTLVEATHGATVSS